MKAGMPAGDRMYCAMVQHESGMATVIGMQKTPAKG